MIVFDIPEVILQFWEKVKIFNFLGPDLVWCLWTLYVCSWDMVYAVWIWYMLLEDGICCMDMEDVLLLEKNICAVYTVHLLYIQYIYCTYSTCTVCTVHVLYVQYMFCRWNVFSKKIFEKKWLWKNDVIFWKYMIFNKKLRFLLKNITFELLDHHSELNQKKLIL